MKPGFAQSCTARLAGWFLLVILVLGHLPLLPLGTAAVAALDGEHRVEFSSSATGVSVVLRHDHRGGALQHRHLGLVKLIAGEDTTGPHGDHHIVFGASSSVRLEEVKEGGPASALNHSIAVAVPALMSEARLDRDSQAAVIRKPMPVIPGDPAAMECGGRCRHLLI